MRDLEKKMGKLQTKIKYMQEHPTVLGSPTAGNVSNNIIQKNNFIINDLKLSPQRNIKGEEERRREEEREREREREIEKEIGRAHV